MITKGVSYNAHVYLREDVFPQRNPHVILQAWPDNPLVPALILSAGEARSLARALKRHADMAEPPKPRRKTS